MIMSKKIQAISIALAAGLMSTRAFAHADTGVVHAHPHGLELLVGLSAVAALSVFVFLNIKARSKKR